VRYRDVVTGTSVFGLSGRGERDLAMGKYSPLLMSLAHGSHAELLMLTVLPIISAG
jgi:hypothetical protein